MTLVPTSRSHYRHEATVTRYTATLNAAQIAVDWMVSNWRTLTRAL
jgi:hypothetical protein